MIKLENEIEEVLITEQEIKDKISELGKKITADYGKLEEKSSFQKFLAVGVLCGSVMFLADLTRKIKLPLEYDFIAVGSYGHSRVPGDVKLTKDLERPIGGKDVLIIEDIVDTGKTLAYIKEMLEKRGPRSIKIATLVNKTPRREVKIPLDYTGFTINQDKFLVGYGLDYGEKYRNLPYVASLRSESEEK